MKILAAQRQLLFTAFVVSFCLTTVGLGLDLLYHLNMKPKMDQWTQEKLARLPSYLEEASYFQDHDFFGLPSPRNKNLSSLTDELWTKGFAISTEEKETLLSLKDEWLELRFRVPQKDVSKLFDSLESFDHFQPFSVETPVYPFDFVALSQIRLAQTVDTQHEDQQRAQAQVRRLATLLIWSQNFNFQLAALSILEKEEQFVAYLNRRQPAEKMDTPVITAEETRRFRNFIYGTYDYLDILMPADVLQKIFLTPEWPIGYCSVIQAKAPSLSARRPYFESSWPLEPGFQDSISAYDQILGKASTSCAQWQGPGIIDPPLTSKIPFLRRLVGLRNLLKNKSMAQGL